MKISTSITEQFGGDAGATPEEMQAGMLEKSQEFAAAGNRVYPPLAE
jgi:phosphomethylpyrimidine synthase